MAWCDELLFRSFFIARNIYDDEEMEYFLKKGPAIDYQNENTGEYALLLAGKFKLIHMLSIK